MKKKLVFMTSALMAVSLLTGCGNNHVHNWGKVVYEWSTDHKSCTATRVCEDDESHKETETKNSVYAVTKEAKCEENGSGRYTVTFDNEVFGTTHFDITLEQTGHEWGAPTYTWSDDYSSCTATRVCLNDENHIETETADSAYTEIIPATCDTNGSAVYDVAFENEAFEVQTHEITLPSTGHSWGTPTYTWAEDYSLCTATRVCLNDENHIESETASSAYTVTLSPTCYEEGTGVYDVAFENEAFEVQTHEVTLPATGHTWGTPTYTWAEDNSTCTATRVCKNDSNHIESETVDSAYKEITPATCEVDGKGKYTVDFTSEAFVDQTKDITLEAIGHNLTAHDAHAETCKKAGSSAYWSCERCGKFFSDAEGKNEIENGSWIIPAHAHDLIHNDAKAASCYVPGNIEYWVCKECFQYFSDEACEHPIDQEDVRTPAHHTLTAHDAHAETCTEAGNSAYWSCERCDKFFSDEEGKNEIENNGWVIPAKDHSWNTPTYTWSNDYSSCTATRVCKNDSNHIESETVDSTSIETEASYFVEGSITYTATFTSTAFSTQTYQQKTSDKVPYYGEVPLLSEDGKTLTYGLYPQTNVNDEELLTALNALTTPETNGYYLHENAYYAKLSATPQEYIDCTFDNGTAIEDGTIYWFKCEPIIWNVLSNTDGEYYIISSVVLDAHCYYNDTNIREETIYPNNYEHSDIRSWLNDEFYNLAFALNKSYIQTTTVDNSVLTTSPSGNPYVCNETQDKVFLPSYQDYIDSDYGFVETNTRYCKTTDWARARGAYCDCDTSSSYLYNGFYWTRSPYSTGSSPTNADDVRVWYVNTDGELLYGDCYYENFSVRPAISIKIA